MKRNSSIRILPLVAVASLLLVAGCGGSSSENDGPAFTIVSTAPAAGASDVALDTPLIITFSSDVDAASATAAFVVRDGDSDIPLTQTVVGAVVTLTAGQGLELLRTYELRVSASVQGTNGGALGDDVTQTFTTRAAAWATPMRLDAATNAVAPELAVDADGNASVAWRQTTSIVAARSFTVAGGWADVQVLGTNASSALSLAARAGRAVLAWQGGAVGNDVIASVAANGVWSASTLIEAHDGTARSPRAAIDDAGNARVAWFTDSSTTSSANGIETARKLMGGPWQIPSNLCSSTTNCGFPQLAINASGVAAAAYTLLNTGTGIENVAVNRASSGDVFASRNLVADPLANASLPQVVVADDGAVHTFWLTGTQLIASFQAANAGSVSTRVDSSNGAVGAYHLARDAAGSAIAVWSQPGNGAATARIWASRFVNNVWTTPALIDSGTGNSSQPRITGDAAGNLYAAWTQANTGGGVDAVSARYTAKTDTWAPQVTLDNREGAAAGVRIATDAKGRGFALWTQTEADNSTQIWASRLE